MKVSIIVPVFNEEETILTVLKKIESAALPAGLSLEIIVVDDGSTDDTRKKLNTFNSRVPFILIRHTQNLGKGEAVMNGIEHSSADIILIQDADLEYDPADYQRLLEPIVDGRSSVVYGSRFKGMIKDMSWVNRFANLFSNWTLNALYGCRLTDVNTCYKVFKKETLQGIKILSRSFNFDTEFTCKILRRRFSILEIPIHYQARGKKHGKKMTWIKAVQMYGAIIKYRFAADKKQ